MRGSPEDGLDRKHEKQEQRPRGATGRRPYSAPAVQETAEFETLAMGCGKDSPVIPSCAGGNIKVS